MGRATVPDELDELPHEDRGFVLGAALSGQGPGAASALAGTAAARCAEQLERLAALPRSERGACLARVAASALPAPLRLAGLHPSWIESVLIGTPGTLVLALAAGQPPVVGEAADAAIRAGGEDPLSLSPLPLEPELVADLQRLAFAALTPLMDGPIGPTAARLTALPMEDLLDELSAGVRGPTTMVDSAAALPVLREALLREGESSLRRVAGRLPRSLGLRLLGVDPSDLLADAVCG